MAARGADGYGRNGVTGVAKMVVGILLALVLVLGFLLLCLRVGVLIQAGNDGVFIQIKIGLLHKTIRPRKGRRLVKEPDEQPEKPEMPQEELDKFRLPDLDWGDLICEGLSFLEDVKERLRIDVLRVNLLLATGDAAKTGMYLGGLSALAGMIYPFLEKNFQIRDFEIRVDGDFEGNTTQYDLRLGCSFRPVRMIGATVRHGRKLYHMIKQKQSVEAK